MLWATAIFAEAPKQEPEVRPLFYLVLSGESYSILDLSGFAEHLRDGLLNLKGVGDVSMIGGRRPVLRIRLDTARLAAYGLTPRAVDEELLRQTIKVSPGIATELREVTLLSKTDLPSPSMIGEIILAQPEGVFIRLRDVATIELGFEAESLIVRYQGQQVVALGISKQWWATPLQVLAAVLADWPAIRAKLPPGMWADLVSPSSIFRERPSN